MLELVTLATSVAFGAQAQFVEPVFGIRGTIDGAAIACRVPAERLVMRHRPTGDIEFRFQCNGAGPVVDCVLGPGLTYAVATREFSNLQCTTELPNDPLAAAFRPPIVQALPGSTKLLVVDVDNTHGDLNDVVVDFSIDSCDLNLPLLRQGAQASYSCLVPPMDSDLVVTVAVSGNDAEGAAVVATAQALVFPEGPRLSFDVSPAYQLRMPGEPAAWTLRLANATPMALLGNDETRAITDIEIASSLPGTDCVGPVAPLYPGQLIILDCQEPLDHTQRVDFSLVGRLPTGTDQFLEREAAVEIFDPDLVLRDGFEGALQ